MKTQINQGKAIEVTTPGGGYISGQVVKVGSLIGISSNTYVSGDTAVIWLLGTHFIAKTTGQAWTAGALLYWDNTNSLFTTTASGNTLAGYVYADAASADATGYILFRQ
jgi:predicted RecA/RadA family phage recombinase